MPTPTSSVHVILPLSLAYKRRPPQLQFSTPSHSPLSQNHLTSSLEQGEHQTTRISLETVAAGGEECRRLWPPQETSPVPGEPPSSTTSFTPIADPCLSPGEPPQTLTGLARVHPRR